MHHTCLNHPFIKKYFVDFTIVLLISLLTVNKLAPSFLNADVIMNSIMSLQKVTIFYWGQNRLFNLVPLILSPIKAPGYNLGIHLVFFSFTFFMLLYIIAGILKKRASDLFLHSQRMIFFVLVFCLFFLFKPSTVFDIVIGHIEYSLSYLLLIVCFLFLLSKQIPVFFKLSGSIVMLFLATGVNFSIVIPALFLALHMFLSRKTHRRSILLIGFSAIFFFFIWQWISSYSPSPGISYGDFDLSDLVNNLIKVTKNIAQAIYPLRVCCFSIISILTLLFSPKRMNNLLVIDLCSLAFLCCGWIFLFSNSAWIHANQYHFRYFILTLMGFLIILVFFILRTLDVLHPSKLLYKTILCSLILYFLISSFPFQPWEKYSVFERVGSVTVKEEGNQVTFYGGDYWYVWPAVMRDLIQGKEAFGICFRGDSNRSNVVSSAEQESESRGYVKIICLNASETDCQGQADHIWGKRAQIVICKNKEKKTKP